MDYSALAAELLSFRTALHHLPAVRGLDEMSGGEYFVLHFLLRHGGTAGPSELSRSLYASSARIAALLKHLEAKGWIVRTPDADDERRVDVVLTEAGAACIRERLGAVLDEGSVLLSALSPEEVLAFLDEEISNMDDEALSVPVGSLLFPTFFAGRGFSIPVRVLALNSTNADFYSSIESVGINQSVQQIRITFTISLSFLTPVGISDTDVTSDVLAAQTILLGDVPESYLYLG